MRPPVKPPRMLPNVLRDSLGMGHGLDFGRLAMTTEDLMAPLRSAAESRKLLLVPGRVQTTPAREEQTISITGSIDDYLTTVQALGIPVVFASTRLFDEGDLFLEPDSGDNEYDNDDEPLDLRTLAAFRRFSARAGEPCAVDLIAVSGGTVYAYTYNLDWHVEFNDLLESERPAIDSAFRAAAEERRKQFAHQKSALTRRFRALRDDPDIQAFVHKGWTLRALIQFVRETHFLDDEVPENVFKELVTSLRDAILSARER